MFNDHGQPWPPQHNTAALFTEGSVTNAHMTDTTLYTSLPFVRPPRRVPAPAQPLILNDHAASSFSSYITHDQQVSSTRISCLGSSAVTPSSTISWPSASSDPQFQNFNFSPPSFAPPVLDIPVAPVPERRVKRLPGACTRCKKMKMKCEFRSPFDTTCWRCEYACSECIVEGRKPRTPSQREWLLSQIRQKDATIATLLKSYRPLHVTPITLASTKLSLPPAQRAAHREALAWAEKGVRTTASRRRGQYREHLKDKHQGNEDDEDDSSSADSSDSEESWDVDADNAGISTMYADALPDAGAPLGVIARLSLEEQAAFPLKRTADAMEAGDKQEDEWGIANSVYFQPGPSANLALRRVLNRRETPPMIITSGLITWSEAEKLFDVFYEFVNPHVSVLDPVLHTCSSVFERCPCLFTVICAISLRYNPPRPGLHRLAMHFAKTVGATAFIDGPKTVELVQAYILLSVFGLPARRWEEDRSWFYGGLATRIAVDLGLNKLSSTSTKGLPERQVRELRSRMRVWLNCFNLDRSTSVLFGKPSAIHDETLIATGRTWYRERYHLSYDIHLVMYVELLRIMSRFREQVYVDGVLNKNCDFRAVTAATETELDAWHDDLTWRYANESDPNDPRCVFRVKGVPFFENYMRLVMYSFGFQNAWKKRRVDPGDMFFAKCLQAASAVVRHVIEVLAPSGYLKYAPDAHFVMSGFCAAFLLKMLRPEFGSLIDASQRVRITTLVSNLVTALASPAVALDDAHTAKLYARFLHGQLRAAEPDVKRGDVHTHSAGMQNPSSGSSSGSSESSGPSSTSSVPTLSPDDAAPAQSMDLCGEEYLATMQAVTNKQWLNSVLMPGFKLDHCNGIRNTA